MEAPAHLSLQKYLTQIQLAVKQQFGAHQWIVAELSDFSLRSNGNGYLSLIESVDGKEVAKCSATMFSGVANLQLKAFRLVTGCAPAPGMKVLVKVSANLHPQYGFQLQVHMLDGNYTLGEMHARVEQIIQRLKDEGIYASQKSLPPPVGYWRIAVISPAQAAGLGDFRRDADRLHLHGLVHFDYYDAVFQGGSAVPSIKDALRQVYEHHGNAPYDAVCLIRGGGAKADLAWLNDYSLARWICRIPIPVYTGIGHERDETVLDLVAHTRFDTPSKVVAAVMRHLHQEAGDLQRAIDQGRSIVARLVAEEENRLKSVNEAYRHLVTQQLKDAAYDLKAHHHSFATGATELVHGQSSWLQAASSKVEQLSRALLVTAVEQFDRLERRYRALVVEVERDQADLLIQSWNQSVTLIRQLVQTEIGLHVQSYHAYHRLVPIMLSEQDALLAQIALTTDALTERLISRHQTEVEKNSGLALNILNSRIQAEQSDLQALYQRYVTAMTALVREEELQLAALESLFNALDPRSVMAKGFALVKSSTGRVLPSAAMVHGGDELVVQFHDGQINARAH
jgi:exodeoxyribonuclease VII large subunit